MSSASVATLVAAGSRQLVLAEIEKCDLVCANCHAVRTYERRLADGGSVPVSP